MSDSEGEADGRPRRLLFPAYSQGIGLGVIIGVISTNIAQLNDIVILVLAFLLIGYSYISEKRVRKMAGQNTGD